MSRTHTKGCEQREEERTMFQCSRVYTSGPETPLECHGLATNIDGSSGQMVCIEGTRNHNQKE